MENENNKNLKTDVKPTPSNKPKLAPKPEPKSFKETLKLLRDKALGIIDTVVDYSLNNFQELYNTATNSFPKNESKNNPEPVQLNEQFVTQELIKKAKQEGDTKEVFLDNHPSNKNMVGSSLVVDMDANKVEATINQLNEKINSTFKDKGLDNEPEVDNKKESKEDKKVDSKNESNNSPTAPKPVSKLKPEPPKPTPNNKKKEKEKDKKIEPPKPNIAPVNIQSTIEAMRSKFMGNQEENPHILEQQTYETVLKPQDPVFAVKNKEAIGDNIALMRKSNLNEPTPNVVEDSFGVEQVKLKARLK